MRTPLLTLTITLTLSLAGMASADVQECRVINDKMTCVPVTYGQAHPGIPAGTPARQVFTGEVTKVLDPETLQVETDGKTVLVRPVINSRWALTTQDVAAVTLHKTVTVYVREAYTRSVLADVLLDNTHNLSNVLLNTTQQTPAAQQFRQQQEEKRAREVAEGSSRRAAAEAARNVPVPSVAVPSSPPSIPPMWLFREYRSAALPGVILEGVTTSSFGAHGHALEGTLRNRTSIPLVFLKLTLEWQHYGTVSDTTTTYAVASEPLPPGGAKVFQSFTSAHANDYRILLSIPGMPQPIVFTPELR